MNSIINKHISLLSSLPSLPLVFPVRTIVVRGYMNVLISRLGSWTNEGMVTSTSGSNNYNVSKPVRSSQ